MALTAAAERFRYVDQDIRLYAVATNIKIWKGAFVGVNAAGFLIKAVVSTAVQSAGIAYETIDNTGGADGAVSVRVWTKGDFELPLSGATRAAIGDAIYASADDTLTTVSSDMYLGQCVGFVSTGIIVVRLKGTELTA